MAGTNLISIRISEDTRKQLDVAAESSGDSRSALIQRLVDEGLRMEQHPGVVFRSGPGGKRPALAGGPDVWEIIRVVRNSPVRGEPAIEDAASYLELPPSQVRVAVAYYADYQDEVDAWLARVDREAAEAEAAWQRQQDVLG